jgi:hypothetical protein
VDKEFWIEYLAAHRHPVNRKLHTTGTLLALLLALGAVLRGRPHLLVNAILVGYALAWLGHFLFERNQPATFKRPVASLRADLRMLWLSLTGQLEAEYAAHGMPLEA